MANIVRRNPNVQGNVPSLINEWDPFRLIDSFLRNDLLNLGGGVGAQQGALFMPAFDIRETKDGYLFQADMPGVRMEDLDISVTGNRLTVSGRREPEEQQQEGSYFTSERSFGAFTRSFTLPDSADLEHIRADLNNGVLTLLLPKRPEMQPRRVQIGQSGGPSANKGSA